MVEIRGFIVFVLVLLGSVASAQELRVRGLEGNEEYISLLEQERELKRQEDSLSLTIAEIRRLYRDQPENREALGSDILGLEGEIFEIRNRKGTVASRMGAIEQEYVTGSLAGPSREEQPAEDAAAPALPDSLRPAKANLAYNGIFAENLPADDYNALTGSQESEERTAQAVLEYRALYGQLAAEAALYAEAETAAEAEEIYHRYDSLLAACAESSAGVEGLWKSIYDNKAYAYNYLLDRLGNSRLLSRFESESAEARRSIAEAGPRSMSGAIAGYANEKPLLLRYELSIAQAYGIAEAVDSLRRVIAGFDPSRFDLPAISVEERAFIDYEELVNSPAPRYSARNPIPPLHIYPRGTVYRVFITSYLRQQAPSLFRGLAPLGYVVGETGSYQYYGGAYRTEAEAAEALPMVRRLGFRSPGVAVWEDGEFRLLSEEAPASYRIEITSPEDALSEEVRSLAQDREISRMASEEGGYTFTIGSFGSREEAEALAAAVRSEDPALGVEVIE